MQAFLNDPKVKTKYLKRVKAHEKADEIVQGFYWEKGKGCAVGCTIHGSDHLKYEVKLGIPEWLALLEDRLFGGLSKKEAKLWPARFLKAIPVGVDLDQVKAPFLIFVLQPALEKFDHAKFPKLKKSLDRAILLYQTGGTPKQFSVAWEAVAWVAWEEAEYKKFADHLLLLLEQAH